MQKKINNKMTDKIECIGCMSYYLYFSNKSKKYEITNNSLEAFNSESYIPLKDESVSDLIKLLQDHSSNLEKNKANLSEIKQGNSYKIRNIVDKYVKNLKKSPKTH